ncbi:hypothetical protein HDU81_000627, partial [Chytriomyces hyalinus]
PASARPTTKFEGDNVSDFIYWVQALAGLQGIVPKAKYNFIKAHFSKSVKQDHDSWIRRKQRQSQPQNHTM